MFNWPTMTYLWVALLVIVHLVFTVWVLIGGWFDLIYLLNSLKAERENPDDDGRVVGTPSITEQEDG